jgi:hypothetical protein
MRLTENHVIMEKLKNPVVPHFCLVSTESKEEKYEKE